MPLQSNISAAGKSAKNAVIILLRVETESDVTRKGGSHVPFIAWGGLHPITRKPIRGILESAVIDDRDFLRRWIHSPQTVQGETESLPIIARGNNRVNIARVNRFGAKSDARSLRFWNLVSCSHGYSSLFH